MSLPVLIVKKRIKIITNVVLPGGWRISVFWTRSSRDSIEQKQNTRKTRIMKEGQAHQVIIVLS